MNRIIVTGANGSGKSHFAARLAQLRPGVPVISVDALKLQTGWQQRPRAEVSAAIADEVAGDSWILEGGPALLADVMGRADAFVWLDPPEYLRALRLAVRPWKFLGKTRPELPAGNVDWPLQQYRFAFRSLANRRNFDARLSGLYQSADTLRRWRCRDLACLSAVAEEWRNSAG